ncbi:uncharacterized protein LOC110109848 [Dendrobium catenatum]|uniref:uncharacterized protein LOC110109848 n=1 Tax=Dendrobium catenatum TaxID=906689 RepID=UPI0009F53FF7|nr:uncharacterized protein LOC110109848 [Dendrobium catenatum]
MDAFSCYLDAGRFSGFPYDQTRYSHLLYAGDILVFGPSTISNAQALNETLGGFGHISGLYINRDKSSILFSRNSQMATDIKNFLGKIQYLKFTIANTIAYWIREEIIPKDCCKIFNRLCARFLYHGSTYVRKLHLIAWNNTSLPYCYGGLGIPDINSMYFGHACSLWRFYTLDSPINSWFRSNFESPFKPVNTKASKFWKLISDTAIRVKHLLKFHVTHSNCKLSMSWNPWVNGLSLANISSSLPPSNTMAREYIFNCCWVLKNDFPRQLIQLISSTPIVDCDICASWTGKGTPNYKNFRKVFFADLIKVPWYKFIWHKRIALRYSSYTGLAVCNGLKTADVLAKRNIIIHSIFPLCDKKDESISHLFFQCQYSFQILETLLPDVRGLLLRPKMLQLFEFF